MPSIRDDFVFSFMHVSIDFIRISFEWRTKSLFLDGACHCRCIFTCKTNLFRWRIDSHASVLMCLRVMHYGVIKGTLWLTFIFHKTGFSGLNSFFSLCIFQKRELSIKNMIQAIVSACINSGVSWLDNLMLLLNVTQLCDGFKLCRVQSSLRYVWSLRRLNSLHSSSHVPRVFLRPSCISPCSQPARTEHLHVFLVEFCLLGWGHIRQGHFLWTSRFSHGPFFTLS